MKVTDEMVDRFLSWRLPITAMPDACVMDRSHDRMGTHVLSFTEAKAMLEHVLAGCDESKSGGDWIACSERLPAANQVVIVEGGVAYKGRDGDWYTITGYAWPGLRIGWDIKHWMPLPMPDGLTCSGVNFNDFSEPHKPGTEPHDCSWCKGRHTGYSIMDCPEPPHSERSD